MDGEPGQHRSITLAARRVFPPQRTPVDLDHSITHPKRQCGERNGINRAWLLGQRELEAMPRALHKPVNSYFTSLQGPARVRAPAIKDVNLLTDLDDANEMPLNLAHLYLAGDQISFPDQPAPLQREHTIKLHRIIRIVNVADQC
jgi:hypothetical protein